MIKTKDLGDGIIGIILDRPGSAHNYQDEDAIKNFHKILEKIASNSSVKGVVISSAKNSFLVGGDLDELRNINRSEIAMQITVRVNNAFRFMEKTHLPFVAAINGPALGGGLELALACNYRIGASEKKLKLGLPEVTLGLMPGGGGTQRLPRLVGYKDAIPMLIRGKAIAGGEALEIGLLDECVTQENLLHTAKKRILEGSVSDCQPWDREITDEDGKVHKPLKKDIDELNILKKLTNKYPDVDPAATAIAKAIEEGATLSLDEAVKVENKYFSDVASSPVAKNKIRTLFYALNTANSYDVRKKNIPSYQISEITTIGAGLMGSGISYKAALAGIRVNLIDLSEALLEKSIKRINKISNRAVEQNLISENDADDLMDLITPGTQYNKIGGSDLVIEAVSENIGIKGMVFDSILQFIEPDVPIASNTSTISINKLAENCKRPDNLIGLHFFAPVERMKLVEVVKGSKTSELTLARALDFLASIKKTPIVVNDCPGFFTSRVIATYTAEAITMLSEGISPELIDVCATRAGMPIGPLAMADMTSLVLLKDIFESIIGDGNQVWVKGINVLDTLKILTEEHKRSGKKEGKGIYSYTEGKTEVWENLERCFPPMTNSVTPKAIEQRLFFVQALEAVRALEEGVIDNPMDGDLASVLGWAFPSAYGGVLGYIDYLGAKNFVSQSNRLADLYGDRFLPPDLLSDMAASGAKFHNP